MWGVDVPNNVLSVFIGIRYTVNTVSNLTLSFFIFEQINNLLYPLLCVCMYACLYVYVLVCVCVYVYVGLYFI